MARWSRVKTAASHAANMGSIPVRGHQMFAALAGQGRVPSAYFYILNSLPKAAVGVDCSEGPPVPIPNTEVKLTCRGGALRPSPPRPLQ